MTKKQYQNWQWQRFSFKLTAIEIKVVTKATNAKCKIHHKSQKRAKI